MSGFKRYIRRLFSPITIMIVPHDAEKTYHFKMPSVGIVILCGFWFSFTAYMINMGVTTKKYNELKDKTDYYYTQFVEVRSTISSIKKAESQLKTMLGHNKGKEDLFKTMDQTDSGSVNIGLIRQQIEESVNTVAELKEYLKQQKDVFYSTPTGLPAGEGKISSGFGWRTHPMSGRSEYHTGVDLPMSPGSSVRATADGIVVYADWSSGNGRLVILEHGFGFTTCYAHNSEIAVKVGQMVKRGDVIAYSGSTGNSTGPHVHYEVWKDNVPIDPQPFLHKDT
ncbi:MAG: M23 family metallopeptidase [Nitrospirae bacterium]|nr:M23 family metallopeptidase [Nitrospirota bacterium]